MPPPAGNSHIFTYKPLPDTGATGQTAPHIRLVEVHDRAPDDPTIRLSIHSISMDNAPPYHAISYTWGGENDQEYIYVEHAGHSEQGDAHKAEGVQHGFMLVRKNCADVLRQLLHFKTTRYYWIDAICIDQQNVQEKDTQVWRMDETYRQADSVMACIGMHDSHSRVVSSMLNWFNSYVPKSDVYTLARWEYLCSRFKNATDVMIKKDQIDLRRKAIACQKNCIKWLRHRHMNNKTFGEFHDAMKELARRPYFWRIWTLQELWVAHRLRIFCDYDELDLPSLLFWWDGCRLKGRTPEFEEISRWIYARLGNSMDFGLQDTDLGFDYLLVLHRQQGDFASAVGQLTFDQWVKIFQERECQDRRDIVYGTLAIVDWTSSKVKIPWNSQTEEDKPARITPDYGQSTFELAKRLMPAFDTLHTMKSMCETLHLTRETEEIHKSRWSKSSGSLARIEGYGCQIGDRPLRKIRTSKSFERIAQSTVSYAISYTAIACGSARNGDWLVYIFKPRSGNHAYEVLVLRELGSLLFVIGKAILEDKPFDWSRKIAVFLDADDAVVLQFGPQVSRSVFDNDDNLRDNMEQVSAILNNRVCREWGSSFATILETPKPKLWHDWRYSPWEVDSGSEDHESADHESEVCELEDHELEDRELEDHESADHESEDRELEVCELEDHELEVGE
jgi:hypothetical protein